MTFCHRAVCHARVQMWLLTPGDPGITDPCPACLTTLERLLGVRALGSVTLRSLTSQLRVTGRLDGGPRA